MTRSEGFDQLWRKEDWWAVWVAFSVFGLAVTGIVSHVPKLGTWQSSPLEVFQVIEAGEIVGTQTLGLILLYCGLGTGFLIATFFMRAAPRSFLPGYSLVFILANLAYLLAHNRGVKAWGLGYAFWALLIGLLISNTLGTPSWLRAGAKTELYIKTGLVLLGAEILFRKILKLGGPGLFVAWLVTPVVILFMYWFGTRFLEMGNRALVIVIATATSVCGVSAAIASAAACKAKKEDLTLAVGMTLIFTVAMMVGMPVLVKMVGMETTVGAAWLGGTIDATGAVVAAGSVLGEEAEKVAAVVKMIQNVLIGVIAFAIAVFWVTCVETEKNASAQPSLSEIWIRFPKFILGFILASLLFSFVLIPWLGAESVEKGIIKSVTKNLRGWLFCMAFVSIGLESNFRELAHQLAGGKPITLYLVGQSFNLILTLIAAYLAFGGILFGS